MPTFQARIEDLVGTVDDTTGLDQFLTDEARVVMGLTSRNILQNYASLDQIQHDAGVSVRGRIALTVSRDSRPARQVPHNVEALVTDAASLHLATTRSPVFFIKTTPNDTRLFVKPAPAVGAEAEIAYAVFPSMTASSSSNSNLPTECEAAVVTGAARRVLQKRMDDRDAEEDVELIASLERQIAALDALYQRHIARLTEVDQ